MNTDAPRMFYIRDTSTTVGNAVVWWRPQSRGYTCHLNEAGKYSEEEARRIERIRGTDKPIPVDVVMLAATMWVDVQHLERVMATLAEANAPSPTPASE